MVLSEATDSPTEMHCGHFVDRRLHGFGVRYNTEALTVGYFHHGEAVPSRATRFVHKTGACIEPYATTTFAPWPVVSQVRRWKSSVQYDDALAVFDDDLRQAAMMYTSGDVFPET